MFFFVKGESGCSPQLGEFGFGAVLNRLGFGFGCSLADTVVRQVVKP